MTPIRPFPYMTSLLLLFLAFGAQAFARKNPCNLIRSDYGAQIKALKHRQKLDLRDCRANSGSRCSGLKKRQKDAMRQLKLERDHQLHGCELFPERLGISLSNTNDCYNARQRYIDDYYNRNPDDDDNYKQPPPGKGRPGKTVNSRNDDGDYHGRKLPRDDSGMDNDSGRYSRRDSSSSPSGSSYDSGSYGSGGGSSVSYSSGSSSGGSSSSGSSNSSSGSSSSNSGGGYSGGGSSGSSASPSSSSSSSSTSSGSSRSRTAPPR